MNDINQNLNRFGDIANLIDSLRKIAIVQHMTGKQTANMIKDFLESFGVDVPESFLNQTIKCEKTTSELDFAKEILISLLSDGSKISTDIFEVTDGENISRTTLLRAKNALNVKSKKVGFAGNWVWELDKVG